MNSLYSKDYQAKMQLLILLFGIAEMCIGFTGVILSDFISVFDLLALLSGTAGFVALIFCITHPYNIKVYDLLGMALMLAYGIGTLNSLVSYTLDHRDLLFESSVTEYWLTRTLGLVTAAAGFLHVIGRLDKKGFLFPQFTFVDNLTNRALWLVGIVAALTVLFIATGKLGFMANIASVEGYVGISSSSAIVLDLIAPAGALALYLSRKEVHSNKSIYFLIVAVVLLVIQFGLGRRIFLFSILIYVMAALLSKRPKKLITVQNIVVVALIVGAIQVATTAFYTMRVATFAFKNAPEKPSIVVLVPEAIQVYKDRDKLNLAKQIHDNLSSRTFLIEYLATLAERSDKIEPLYGQNIARAIVVATPAILYWGKYKNPLFIDEENFLNPHFRLPVWDAANSVFTAGVGDFGELGYFILPVIVCFIFSLYLRLIYAILPPLAGTLISFYLCKVLFSVEEDIVSFFTASRSVFILLGISWLAFSWRFKAVKSPIIEGEGFKAKQIG